jgi:hypothetical protein
MSRTLSLIVAAGCIALGPVIGAEAKPAPRPNHTPVVQKTTQTTEIDYGTLPPEARRMLQKFFAEHETKATQPGRTFRTTKHFQRTPKQTFARPTTTAAKSFDTSSLDPAARKMLQDFFATQQTTQPSSVVHGKISHRPGTKRQQTFTRTFQPRTATFSSPTIGGQTFGTFTWVHDTAQRTQVIRAIGESILKEEQTNRRFHKRSRRTTQAHNPAS